MGNYLLSKPRCRESVTVKEDMERKRILNKLNVPERYFCENRFGLHERIAFVKGCFFLTEEVLLNISLMRFLKFKALHIHC